MVLINSHKSGLTYILFLDLFTSCFLMKFIGWKECELADDGEYLSDDSIKDTPEGKNIHNMILFYIHIIYCTYA